MWIGGMGAEVWVEEQQEKLIILVFRIARGEFLSWRKGKQTLIGRKTSKR